MLEKLNQLVKENAQDAIVNNPDIPNERKEEAVSAASESIIDALKKQVSSGNVSELASMFKGGSEASGNPVVQQASSGFTAKLAAMGVNMDSAKSIAASFIPMLMAKFANKTKDPNDKSFDIQDIMSQISGPDSKFQLSDLTNMLGGKDDTKGGGDDKTGGVIDKLKGLF
ncbi:hypothetical protein [Pedobacter sp.]|uniref:hypothetical protein n=1 Tax=Pedobacter sp. TaxID=1411316 RepID=UPI003D7F5CC0